MPETIDRPALRSAKLMSPDYPTSFASRHRGAGEKGAPGRTPRGGEVKKLEWSGARDRFASCPMARWNERTRMPLSQQRTPRDKAHRLTRKYDQLARVPSIQFKSARGPGGRCQPTIQTARTVPRWHAYCAPPRLIYGHSFVFFRSARLAALAALSVGQT